MAKDTTYLKKIDEIVKQAAVEETFSLDVLNQIQALKKGFEEQTAEIERRHETIEMRDKALTEERKMNRDLGTELSVWQQKDSSLMERETAVTQREAETDKLQLQLNAANQRVLDHQEMMRTVFKNPVLQRATFESKQVPVQTGSGYPQMMTETNSHTQKETIE